MDQQRPTRRMSDLGPRRTMDGFTRPVARPAGQPLPAHPVQPVSPRPPMRQPDRVATAPMPPRPAGPRSESTRGMQPRQMPQAPAEELPSRKATKPAKAPKQAKVPREKSGALSVVLQFIVGLLVIAGVAAAIVALYIRYYQ